MYKLILINYFACSYEKASEKYLKNKIGIWVTIGTFVGKMKIEIREHIRKLYRVKLQTLRIQITTRTY